ncbi:DarT ssDNA thymidine ADP-ribosyltransferase family protein [Neobacillus bataviensis]|uniref:DarT ssDNA thymidine ADP-ribosyltransferase family protein n=1 Tax=Neobacillus bataviensis TaxID=220685 RepID=UPI001CBB4F0C|nr:DarT ssDNA thymidine ADP-ribosyltransferase family protein [Neobacillus bataviensis]
MKYDAELKKTIDLMKANFQFEGLLHFTNFSNLKSIFDSGYLLSRFDCFENGMIFKDGASKDIISKTEREIQKCVRFYYKEQTPTLYVNEGIKKLQYITNSHCPIPVYLLFDENLILHPNTYYSDGNAKVGRTQIDNSSGFFASIDWPTVFSRGQISSNRTGVEIKRKRQAELLSSTPVSLDYLKCIYFRSIADKRRAINLYGNRPYFKVNLHKFSNKNCEPCKEEYANNFISDYKYRLIQKENEFILAIKVEFNKENFNEYHLTYEVNDCHGHMVKCKNTRVDSAKLLNNQIEERKIDIVFFDYQENWETIKLYLNGILSCEIDVSIERINHKRKTLNNMTSIITDNFSNRSLKVQLHYLDPGYDKYDNFIELYDRDMKLLFKSEISCSSLHDTYKVVEIEDVPKEVTYISYLIDGLLVKRQSLL